MPTAIPKTDLTSRLSKLKVPNAQRAAFVFRALLFTDQQFWIYPYIRDSFKRKHVQVGWMESEERVPSFKVLRECTDRDEHCRPTDGSDCRSREHCVDDYSVSGH